MNCIVPGRLIAAHRAGSGLQLVRMLLLAEVSILRISLWGVADLWKASHSEDD